MKCSNFDGFVKSPSVRLRRIALHLRRCGVPPKYASGFARLVRLRRRAFYAAIALATFYEIINFCKGLWRGRAAAILKFVVQALSLKARSDVGDAGSERAL